jgi:hypothetical protein
VNRIDGLVVGHVENVANQWERQRRGRVGSADYVGAVRPPVSLTTWVAEVLDVRASEIVGRMEELLPDVAAPRA